MSSYSPAARPCLPFTTLSVEVFAIIAQYLDLADIQASRLAGRDLYSLSSPYLCRTITFSPHQEDLDRLKKISQDHLLSHHTHTLRYDTTILNSPDAERDALNKLDLFYQHGCLQFRLVTQLSNKPGRFPHHYGTRANGWKRTSQDRLLRDSEPAIYCKDKEALSNFVAEQNEILDHLEEHLQQVISAFPKLTTITFCNSYWTKTTKFKYALRENSISRKWIRRSQLLTLFKVLANTPNCNISKINVQGYSKSIPYRYLDNCDFGDDSNIPGSIKYCLGLAFDTAHYTKESLPIIHDGVSLQPEQVITIQRIFGNLTQLSLSISPDVPVVHFGVPEDEPKSYWADFPNVLESLTKVVDLSLDLNVRRAVDQQHTSLYYHDDLTELLGDLRMPQLERLKLSQFRSCASSVTSLLLEHAKIKDLSLRYIIEIETGFHPWSDNGSEYVWAADPKWVQCIEVMRDLKLRRLCLRGIEGFGHNPACYGSENEDLTLSRIHDYILYGYGDNPLPTRRPVELNGLDWDAELW